MSHSPEITIFVMAYNTEAYLADCMDGVLGLEGEFDIEVILIDDASTDRTEAVARRYDDPRIRYIRHEKNRGAMVTVNEGFSMARGEYVARIDSDDRYRKSFLEETVPVLRENRKVGLVYGDIAMIDSDGRVTSRGGNVERNGLPVTGNELLPLLERNYIPAPTVLARREAWNAALPVPEDLGFADWYLSLGIADRWDFFYVDKVIAEYRIHTTNMHRSMVRDRTGERTTFRILRERLHDAAPRHAISRREQRAVFATNYLVYADKYFGSGMNEDARRCYWNALIRRPSLMVHGGVFRRFVASCAGRGVYEMVKKSLRRA